jgi:hypothetical protein
VLEPGGLEEDGQELAFREHLGEVAQARPPHVSSSRGRRYKVVSPVLSVRCLSGVGSSPKVRSRNPLVKSRSASEPGHGAPGGASQVWDGSARGG